MDIIDIAHLQTYLREKAHQGHEIVAVPPFTLFVDLAGAGAESNYAIPDTLAGAGGGGALARLRAAFAERGRAPRIQFLDAFAPDLPAALRAAGFVELSRAPLLICTPASYHQPPAPDLTFVICSSETPLADVRENLDVNALGFDPGAARATDAEAEAFRRSLIISRAFTARLDGQGVGAGMFLDIRDGLTELAGITTLAPFRRRGVGAALTAHMAHTAFTHGVVAVFLIPASEQAGRAYERVGFQPYAALLEFSDA
jgi:GNAT superfamily N-acetyltransferase